MHCKVYAVSGWVIHLIIGSVFEIFGMTFFIPHLKKKVVHYYCFFFSFSYAVIDELPAYHSLLNFYDEYAKFSCCYCMTELFCVSVVQRNDPRSLFFILSDLQLSILKHAFSSDISQLSPNLCNIARGLSRRRTHQ